MKKAYVASLEKLRDELTREENISQAIRVSAEIKKIEADADVTEEEEKAPSGDGRELVTLRGKYQAQLNMVIGKNNGIYRKALESLKSTYAKSGDLDSAIAVTAELTRLAGAEPGAPAGPDDLPTVVDASLPQTVRQLTEFLNNTRWKAGGNTFDFTPDGMVTMPYHPCEWKAIGKRQASMLHPRGHWKKDIEFSEDMTRITIKQGGKNEILWEGVFRAKLDAEGNELPAEDKQP